MWCATDDVAKSGRMRHVRVTAGDDGWGALAVPTGAVPAQSGNENPRECGSGRSSDGMQYILQEGAWTSS